MYTDLTAYHSDLDLQCFQNKNKKKTGFSMTLIRKESVILSRFCASLSKDPSFSVNLKK